MQIKPLLVYKQILPIIIASWAETQVILLVINLQQFI